MQIMAPSAEPWVIDAEEPLPIQIGGWSPSTAKVAFLDRFEQLRRA
jgi:hypothetical protein